MSFFIRSKSKKLPSNNSKKRKPKLDVPYPKKKKSNSYSKIHKDDEEISSDEDEDEVVHKRFDSDEEVQITAQEKKLQLAKKYLSEIEEQEREKQENGEVDHEAVANRLREDVLEQAGKLRKRVSDKIKTTISPEDVRILRCKDHKLSVTCVVFTNDGQHLFSGSKDASIVKWSVREGKKVQGIPPKYKRKEDTNLHSTPISALAVSKDDRWLASAGGGEMEIRLWDVITLAHVHTFKGHRGPITDLTFCRVTDTLFSCSKDKTIKLWSPAERAYLETLFGHQAEVTGIDWLAKDRVVTSGGTDDTLRVWKIKEESHLIFNGHSRSADCVARLSERNFVSCGDDGDVCLWSILKKKPLHSIKLAHGTNMSSGEPNWIVSVGAMTNTEVFASGSSDGMLRLWAAALDMKGASPLLEHPLVGFINAISFSSDRRLLAVGVGQEHRLGRWNRIPEAKNAIVLINIRMTEEEDDRNNEKIS